MNAAEAVYDSVKAGDSFVDTMKNATKAAGASTALQVAGLPFKSHSYNYKDTAFISGARAAKALNRRYGPVQGFFEFVGDLIN
ncbi:MAG: hypothetical protein E7467_03335 [Ruminococcaceae bacterium]|nr:hypothetical protein [Oscillospiraceae bacterium]